MPAPGGSAKAVLIRLVPVALFVGIPSILILPLVFSGKMLYGADVASVFHYSRIVIAESFKSGRLPVWDPHVMCGFPLLAAVQGAVFYPPTWLCIFLSAGTFWTLSVLVHFTLSGIFAQRWLERGLGVGRWAALAGGFVFMMSGFIVTRVYAGHVNYLWAYPWMAALLWRLERYLAGPTLKRGVWLAVVLALLFLAGVPQFVFFAGLLAGARLVHFVLLDREGRRERVKVAGVSIAWLGLGLLFTGPQLLPSLELASQMQRGATEDEQFLTDFSLQFRDLTRILFPGPSPEAGDQPNFGTTFFWEKCGFFGGAALLLAATPFSTRHRQRLFWAGVAVVGLLLSLGETIPLYKGFILVVPGAGLFRGPGRYLLLFSLGGVALVALGFEALWTRPRLPFRIAAAALAGIAAIQLFGFGSGFFTGQDEKRMRWPEETVAALRQDCGLEGRIASTGGARIQFVGKCQAEGIDQVCGYDPMMLRRYAELMNAARGASIGANIPVLASVGHHPVIDMLCARVWMRKGGLTTENAGGYPRAWLVNHAIVLESREERLKQIAQGPFNARKTVILEEMPDEAPPVPSDTPGRARVVSRGPGEYRIEAENGADAYLVLSEAYYPGWRAEIDGKPAEVLPANHLIQAIRLPPGKHDVRFSYRSRFLVAGFVVAFLAALVPGLLSWKRSRASAAASAAPSTAGS